MRVLVPSSHFSYSSQQRPRTLARTTDMIDHVCGIEIMGLLSLLLKYCVIYGVILLTLAQLKISSNVHPSPSLLLWYILILGYSIVCFILMRNFFGRSADHIVRVQHKWKKQFRTISDSHLKIGDLAGCLWGRAFPSIDSLLSIYIWICLKIKTTEDRQTLLMIPLLMLHVTVPHN